MRRTLLSLAFAGSGLLATIGPASAQNTGRFEQCSVYHDTGAVMGIFTIPRDDVIQAALETCSQIDGYKGWHLFNQPVADLNNLPGYTRVCMVTYDNAQTSLNMFASPNDYNMMSTAVAGCDGGRASGQVTYDIDPSYYR